MNKFTKLPEGLKKVPLDKQFGVVLAYGEETGHKHKFDNTEAVNLYTSNDITETRRYLEVNNSATLVHEEHTSHTIEKGIGDQLQQQEYYMSEIRRVTD